MIILLLKLVHLMLDLYYFWGDIAVFVFTFYINKSKQELVSQCSCKQDNVYICYPLYYMYANTVVCSEQYS